MEDSLQVPAGCVTLCKSLDLSGLCFLLYKMYAFYNNNAHVPTWSLRTNGKCERTIF